MSKNFLLLWLLFFPINLTAQSLVGKKMPSLNGLAWVQQPEPLLSLRPKFIVIECWATWCSPCIANLQHLNELSASLDKEQVAFLSITDEDPSKIERFLKKRKMNGWVACDTSNSIFKSLNIQSLPRTLILNDKGVICFDGRPEDLSAKKILSANLFVETLPPSANCAKTGSWGPGVDPAFTAHFSIKHGLFPHQQTIRKSIGITGSGYTFKEHFSGITLLNQSLSDVIAFCNNFQSSKRVLNTSTINDSLKWDIIFSENKLIPSEKMMAQIIQITFETFNVKIRDTAVNVSIKVPYHIKKEALLNEKDIDFSAPETHTYKTLTEIYCKMEKHGNVIVKTLATDSEWYIDIFDIVHSYHNINAQELQKWLLTKGIRFEEEQQLIPLKYISDK